MTQIIDLGAGPSGEPLARPGIPTYAWTNQLELESFQAALTALHGSPPAGCSFVLVTHGADPTAPRTLALSLPADADATAQSYAEAVGRGLATWPEAGFVGPVAYTEDGPHARQVALEEVVINALANTRPGFDGGFAVPAFAAIHANLAAAYPTFAAELRRRAGRAQPLVRDSEPLLGSDGFALQGLALAQAVVAAALAATGPLLAGAGIARVAVSYDGSGDEGAIEAVTGYDAGGAEAAIPVVPCLRHRIDYAGRVTLDVASLELALEELALTALATRHDGWENNDGAYGALVVDVAARTARLEHHARYIAAETIVTEL